MNKLKALIFYGYMCVLTIFGATEALARQNSNDSNKRTFDASCNAVRASSEVFFKTLGVTIDPVNGRPDLLSFSANIKRLKDSRGKRIVGKDFDTYMVPPQDSRVRFPRWISDKPYRLMATMHFDETTTGCAATLEHRYVGYGTQFWLLFPVDGNPVARPSTNRLESDYLNSIAGLIRAVLD